MKWVLAAIIFVFIGVTVQDEFILRLAKSGYGFNENNTGEFFKEFSQWSDNCNKDSNTVLEFDIDTGARSWSLVEFTSPMKIDKMVRDTYVNETVIRSIINVVHNGKCQIDAKVYLRPENYMLSGTFDKK